MDDGFQFWPYNLYVVYSIPNFHWQFQQNTFLNITRGGSFSQTRMDTTEEFGSRLNEAINRYGRMLEWDEEKLERLYQHEKKNDYKNEIRFAAGELIRRLNKRIHANSSEQEETE